MSPVSMPPPRSAHTAAIPEGSVIVEVQTAIHPIETVLRAAHRFSARFYVDIRSVATDTVHVQFKPKTLGGHASVEDDFRNELLDEGLRALVAKDSLLERNLILAHALSRHPVLQTEYEAAEAFSDPFNLLAPDKR